MRARLANAYLQAGGDDEKAARILRVTVGSAGWPRDGTWTRQKETIARNLLAPRRALGSLGHLPVRPLIVSVTRR